MDYFFNGLEQKIPLLIYTDGSCIGNPGKGGWGVHMIQGNLFFNVRGDSGNATTTNNRMEMTAVIEALRRVVEAGYPGDVEIYSDSRYVVDGMKAWISTWKKNNWKTFAKNPVKNDDLWKAMDTTGESLKGKLSFNWVRGHSGIQGNTIADSLARRS